MGTKFRIRSLSMRDQQARFRAAHPGFTTHLSGSRLVCRGRIQPTPLNNEYLVRITYEFRGTPRVEIEEPKLRHRNPDERIPHTYSGDEPCTFRPQVDWRSDVSLAFVVPWVSLWLLSYETWLATGDWLFGGAGHEVNKSETQTNEGAIHDQS